MDQITLARIELLHPSIRSEVREIYAEICKALTGKVRCRFSHTFRTFKEQKDLYAIGRNGDRRRRITNAKPGLSYHNYGLAIDIVLLIDNNGDGIYEQASWDTLADFDKDKMSDWSEIVTIFKSYGWAWGGDWNRFKDEPHFEKTFGYSVRQLLTRHTAKQFIKNTQYVKL
jgi:peptidoglycan L-alanyl-D-glutamate endopeptidase CwlK